MLQFLEEADAARSRQLEHFRREVDVNLAHGALRDFELPVTGNDGSSPIVVALAHGLVSKLTERIHEAGGYANVFVKDSQIVHFVSVIAEAIAIGEPDDVMVGEEALRATSTIGVRLAYVARNPKDVNISAVLGHPACLAMRGR